MSRRKDGRKIQLYCKCEGCESYFDASPKRAYCSRRCRDKAYYDRGGREKYKLRCEVKKKAADVVKVL